MKKGVLIKNFNWGHWIKINSASWSHTLIIICFRFYIGYRELKRFFGICFTFWLDSKIPESLWATVYKTLVIWVGKTVFMRSGCSSTLSTSLWFCKGMLLFICLLCIYFLILSFIYLFLLMYQIWLPTLFFYLNFGQFW